jgi:uncharacterized membrane protein YgcG
MMNDELKTRAIVGQCGGCVVRRRQGYFIPLHRSSFIVHRSSFRSFIVHRSSSRGMTLVEMLTAMMVSVMLIGTAFSTFWAATQAWDKSKRRSEMIRLMEGSAQLLTRYLRAIQPPFLQGGLAFVAINDGDEEGDYDSICFYSSANPRFPRELAYSDLCEVEFYIDTGTKTDETAQPTDEMTGEAVDQTLGNAMGSALETATGTGGLWLRIDPTPDDDLQSSGYLIELGAQITSLNFRFFDGAEWVEDWLDDTRVPVAVEFTLIITDPTDRENPMILTRLVTIPLAKAINDGAFATTGGSTTSADSGSSDSGQSGSSQSGGASSGGGTYSVSGSGGASGR